MTFVPILRSLRLAVCLVAVPFVASAVDAPPVPTLQSPVGARLRGPRRIATTESGQILVVEARGNLQLLTRRGDFVATLLTGVQTVTAGDGKIFASTERAELVTLDGRYGKVLARTELGLSNGPTGMAFDSAKNLIWMVYASGMVEARRLDGSVARSFGSSGVQLFRLAGVSVDTESGLVWVAENREDPGGMIFGLDPDTGAKVKAIGVSGNGPAKLTGALLAAAGGRIYVADMVLGKVQVVGTDDVPVHAIGLSESGAGMLSQPSGMAFMQNGDLLVASLFAGRLDRFGDGSPLPSCDGDADCDGMSDEWEAARGLDSNDARDSFGDADGDGLQNLKELELGTDPNSTDSDGDGFADDVEVATGYNPLDARDHCPVVVAGSAGEFAPGKVTLQATLTNVIEGATCTVSWTQSGGAPVTLTGADSLAPSFVARRAGTYTFTVGAQCAHLSSDPVQAAATILNLAPIPNVARISAVEVGEHAPLSARRASDANGDSLAFNWEQLSGPAVSGVSHESVISPRFSSPGSYRFKVTVSDRGGASAEEEVSVVAVGSKPVPAASVASPIVAQAGQQVTLDASASYRHDDAVFSWRQVAGAEVALLGAGAPVAGFVAAEPGRYAFEVVISQNGVRSPAAEVEVFVGAGQLPVAVAAAPAVASVGSAVSLDGSASGSASGGALVYGWRQVSGPAAGLGSIASPVASAHLFAPGSYEFELTVKDGANIGVPARVRVEARRDGKAIPVARVTAPAEAHVGERVALDATASTGARAYRWTQVAGPWILLEDERIETFRPHKAGTYVFELEVDDGQVRSAPARVSVVVTGDEEN